MFASLAAGCAATHNPPSDIQYTATDERPAEWHDLRAAVSHAASEHELALLRTYDHDPAERVFELLSTLDDRVWIRFTLAPTPAPGSSPGNAAGNPPSGAPAADVATPTRIAVRYGRFGDPHKERAILATLRDRLAKLIHTD